jgi:SSS family solute:Na+ symporter
MTIGIFHVIGIVITLALIAGVGVYSGRKVSDASDFTTGGGKAGAWLVCGAIMGSLVSGQATVGTAQLAFQYGLSAWWFTLGAGIGCLFLAIGYVIPLRHSGSVTLLEIISNEYGKTAGYIGSVLCSIGIFISVIAQVLAAAALITTIFNVSTLVAAAVSIVIMAIYVVFGGAWGAGMGGVVKLILLYAACILGCILVLGDGGLSGLLDSLRTMLVGTALGENAGITSDASFSGTFLSLIARGAAKDIGSGVSLLLGVLSTQTYAQAIWSAKSDSAARKGSLLSACLIPPIGIACILIGLYMRKTCITTDEIAALTAAGQAIPTGLTELSSTAQAFPMFVVQHMPALIGGIVLGILFITVVGGGAGLSLGVATILVNDIFKKVTKKLDTPATTLHVTRLTLVCVLIAAAIVSVMVPGAVINDFGFLSMGLRGAVVFIPMTFALFCKGRIQGAWATASVIVGPVVVLVGNVLPLPIDSLFIGIIACLIIMLIGLAASPKKNTL